jgi:Ribonuclease G/E
MTPENDAAWAALVSRAEPILSGTIQPCETCDGEGRIIRRPSGGNVWDEIDCGPCPDCDGSGVELLETERVTLNDIINLPIETIEADWYAEYLAEHARKDADDRQGDFYDGDGGHDLD